MSLQIGQVARLLDISVETIRFYEQQNIVMPSRKNESKYRLYETWDIFYLMECIYFRNLGFSVKEIASVLHEENLDFLLRILESREAYMQKEIQYNTIMLEYLKNYRKKLETIALNEGNFWFHKQPERKFFFFTQCEGGDIYSDIDSTNSLLTAWIKKFPLVESAQHILLDDLSSRDEVNRYFWSLIVEARLIPILELPVNATVRSIPPQLCLCTIINAGERGELSLKLLEPALRYIKKSDFEICGPIIGNLLVRIHENQKHYRYLEMMIPVKKDLY